jgi:hypothetical protein
LVEASDAGELAYRRAGGVAQRVDGGLATQANDGNAAGGAHARRKPHHLILGSRDCDGLEGQGERLEPWRGEQGRAVLPLHGADHEDIGG